MPSITGLATAGTNSLVDMMNYWSEIGVFKYVLPFLLVFAVIYGILSKTRILGDKKGVNAVIGIAIGLLALQFDIVPEFFATIFPYAGVGLSILLVALILMGLFGLDLAKNEWPRTVFFGLGTIITIFVVYTSLTSVGKWSGGAWWNQFGSAIITILVIAGLIFVVLGKSGESEEEKKRKKIAAAAGTG